MNRFIPVALLMTALAAAGCAGPAVRGESAAPPAGETTFDVVAKSYAFTPSVLNVPSGKPFAIRVRNEATVVPHSFVLEGPGGSVAARQELARGGETILRIPALPPGTYPFYCDKSFLGTSHRGKGMEGKLIAGPEK